VIGFIIALRTAFLARAYCVSTWGISGVLMIKYVFKKAELTPEKFVLPEPFD